jgi:hypothetical protein
MKPRMPNSPPAVPDDCHVADDQRRNGENLGVCGIGDLSLPYDLAGRLVDGEHAPVEGD